MKEEIRPYSLTSSKITKELTELEKIKAKMISDVVVALIGCCEVYPCAHVIAMDAKKIVELCFNGEEVINEIYTSENNVQEEGGAE